MLTHCNAGWLATVDWGTALAGVYAAHDAGVPVHVWVDETRPRNQGAALTAWELGAHGVPHTVIVDNAGGHLMQRGQVDVVLVGTDRTTAAGDVVNKIGTYLKALAARDCGVPFYVAAPSPSIDWTIDGAGDASIPIEERSPRRGDDRRGRDGGGRRRARCASRRRAAPRTTRASTSRPRASSPASSPSAASRPRRARGWRACSPSARRRPPRGRAVTAAHARRAIADTVRWLMARGLYAGTSGNVSARTAGGLLITPSGVPCDDVDAASIVDGDASTATRAAGCAPSTRMAHPPRHLPQPPRGRRRRPHALDRSRPRSSACAGRSPRSTTWSRRRAATTSAARATRPTAPRRCRATRSRALAGGRRACLLANHGLVALGADLASARLLAEEVEALCAQYIHARAAGTPVVLPAREMTRVRAKFATYGATSAARPARR